MTAASAYRLEDSLGHRLSQLACDMKAELRGRVARYDVTTQQCPALMVLYREDCLNVTELAERIGVDFGGTSRLVDRLVAKGLLSDRPDGTDRRTRRMELTRTGRQIAQKVLSASQATNQVFSNRMSQREARQLQTILQKLGRAGQSREATEINRKAS